MSFIWKAFLGRRTRAKNGTIETILRDPLPLFDDNGLLGLPTTGFAVERFVNKNAGVGLNANYGGIFQHKGTRMTSYGSSD